MKRPLLTWFLLFLVITGSLSAKKIDEQQEFILLTIPKCGSNLINKFLILASKKRVRGPRKWFPKYADKKTCPTNSFDVDNYLNSRDIEKVIRETKRLSNYLYCHTNFSRPFFNYLQKHHEMKFVLQVRDLRDACISLVYWHHDLIVQAIGEESTFDEKLLFVISGSNSIYKNHVFNLRRCAMRAVEMMNHPNVIVTRFEDLVGSKGGGDDLAQLQLISKLVEELSLPVSAAEQKYIASILWGDAHGVQPTFRKGQINKWKEIFTPEHKKLFKKYFGSLLIELGYESDNQW